MTIKMREIDTNYIQYGEGPDIVLLHGWGQNIEMMMPLANEIGTGHRITILDFPGHGKSQEPTTAWTIYDYVQYLEDFLKKLQVRNPILIGHSFGGRVAILYASRNKVDKVILFGAPCIRNRKPSLKENFYKSIKKLPGMKTIAEKAKNHIGSTDYRNATPVMRETLVKVINEDLSNAAKKIQAPTLLIWGTLDTEAPIEEARALEKIIPDAGLVELPGYTHYAYLEALNYVSDILNRFIGGEK